MKKTVKKKAIIIVGIVLVGLFYLFCLYKMFRTIAINSDFSSLVLEANDVISGNVFLSGWNLTGISFLFTDLLYFIGAVLFFGVSTKTYYVAVTMMFFMVVLIAWFLIDKWNVTNMLIMFVFAMLPVGITLDLLRAHTGVYVLYFAILLLWKCYCNTRQIKKQKYLLILIGVLFALASASDMIILIVGLGPILIMCIVQYVHFKYNRISREEFMPYVKLSLFSLGGSIVGMGLEKLYFIIGGCNKNSFIVDQTYVGVSGIKDKLDVYINAIVSLNAGNIFGQHILNFDVMVQCVNLVFTVVCLSIVIYNIVKFIQGKSKDSISFILSMGFVLISLVFVFTSLSSNLYSARYMAVTPIIHSLLLIRFLNLHQGVFKKIRIFKIIFIVLLCFMSVYNIRSAYLHGRDAVQTVEQKKVVQIMKENHLTNGYANFWDSAIVTVLSQEKVKTRQVQMGDVVTKYNWFCKDSWYKEKVNFVLVRNPEWVTCGVTEDNCRKLFGEPSKILEEGNYKVLIYDYNLRKKIK